jgi:predicted nucleic acid-binding protein
LREAEERRALEIIREFTEKEYSLVDATSFAALEWFHLTQAFALEHHLAQDELSFQPG